MAKAKKRRSVNKRVNMRVNSLKETIRNEVIGVFIVGMACLGLVTLFSDKSGVVGGQIKHLLTILAGNGRVSIPLLLGAWGLVFMNKQTPRLGTKSIGVLLLWLVFIGILHLQLPEIEALSKADMIDEGLLGHGGGLIGAGIAIILNTTIGIPGSYVILIMIALMGSLLITNRSLIKGVQEAGQLGKESGQWIKHQMGDFIHVLKNSDDGDIGISELRTQSNVKEDVKNTNKKSPAKVIPRALDPDVVERPLVIKTLEDHQEIPVEPSNLTNKGQLGFEKMTNPVIENTIIPPGKVTSTPVSRQTKEDGNFQLPQVVLLNKSLKIKNPRLNKDLTDNVKILEETLGSFGVKIKVTQVTQGPAITRYEAQPAPGVKVSKITNLADDIALSLASADVRIEAPIPGKSVVGIEVPNKEISMVHFREVLETPEYQESTSKLALCLGKDITGTPVIADLTKMPHLLIAGATGSGKSVCINTLIHSILFNARPDEVKFLLVDPKMVELANYNGIPHLIAPVVTDPRKAAGALKWIVTEMETRYELFAAAGVRDIVRYNFLRTQDKNEEHPPLPYVVVIIDELADLMMVAPGDVEDAICRLAQMARAAGIHLIVATQRPSVDVITGLIKANIPSRIAFAVSSQTDSRTILDMNGAEKLLGRGDMLYYPMGNSKPVRVQGCYLGDKEVENVVSFLQNQAKPEYQEIPNLDVEDVKKEDMEDELFYQAAQLFIESGSASVSLLQRRLRIGYTRAARLMDFLEEKGVVGGYEGSKPREVLMTRGQFELKYGPWVDEIAH
ncbi:DNA segregation ATPase, FtsK/SpoIIIE family [Desulfosporosinus orientis DSM 765]|uniref:DNA segregation ATPase, FtsK/SpoIIIE family n=1 Tax=Desulfosporosinus orientis (strain ATCC 19365 / DSM 765 / NCIMB 8382 / VKM B-1628 / Singapore I) TaxID=768706 RepID=G7WGX0_DESOD|nr:DNA translocase FtsK [Desulfosporosinus orientis]AET68984.1 DNA segregation ATPase, FtsK/SpoIIIE family [Desulfosporosinus orientis DSM 765]